MKPRLQDLLLELMALGPRGVGRRYPPALRSRVAGWVDAEMRRGRDLASLASEVGIGRSTLERWCGSRVHPVPVVVEPEPRTRPAEVSLVAPSGWRLEGLTLQEALEVLGRARC